ncbi:AraC family transcriptional regulator [Microbacteriaceae bacterium VKM Ac-2855]|nr:AraC family transcriptional regulator [Microbacteriaceae bacterium VKM Ac-2855]
MIAALNRVVDSIEEHLTDEIDVADVAREAATTEYHLRRMFSSLAGMPLSEYIRRRRMTIAAADVLDGDETLAISARFGYGSTEAFNRAFRSVHGISPSTARRDGGPLRSQPRIRFRLTIEGDTPMHTRITERPAFRLIGHTIRVSLIHEGVNPRIQEFVAGLPAEEHERLKALSEIDPPGLLQVSADVDPDYAEGSPLTYLHGVAVSAGTAVSEDLDAIQVPAGSWAVFRSSGPHPATLQSTWAATAIDWFPSNPWRLRPGPSMVAVLDRADDFSTATTELWLPVERG